MPEGTCQNCQALLDRGWDGELLSFEEQALLDAHLEACATCRDASRSISDLLQRAERLGQLRHERALALPPLVVAPGRAHRPAWPWALGWVTAALLLGVLIGRGSEPAPEAAPPSTTLVRFVVPVAEAKSVEVIGDFTGWNDRIPLTAAPGGVWVGELRLAPGQYNYVLVIDGDRLQEDPAARRVVDDGFGGKNSVLEVGTSL